MVVGRSDVKLGGKLFSRYKNAGPNGLQRALSSFNTLKMVSLAVILLFFMLYPVSSVDVAQLEDLSNETRSCLNCHQKHTPGLVEDWRSSEHALNTPAGAFQKDRIERKVSVNYISYISSEYRNNVVGCYECHSQNTEEHNDSFTHFGYRINVVVSPNDCSTCHPVERDQYSDTVKAHAYNNLEKNSLYKTLYETMTTVYSANGTELTPDYSPSSAHNETCFACHGTKLSVNGIREVERSGVNIKVPNIQGWPNQGVGRINPDGSEGSCTACHPRHGFDISTARKPYTCGQCHYKPDVPAYNVYKQSKHGNIFFSEYNKWNFSSVPWTVGEDFTAPTCSACHNSLVVDKAGNVVSERTHDFDSRIWVRLFGIYSHPQPINGSTYKIVNEDDQPLPTTLTGEPASKYLISEQEQAERKEKMKKVCIQCHSTEWVENHFEEIQNTNNETDRMVLEATKLMSTGWEKDVAEGLPSNSNPFDEHLERLWVDQWLFYATSSRHASAMMGPEILTFELGWSKLTNNLYTMSEYIDTRSSIQNRTNEQTDNQDSQLPGFEAYLVGGAVMASLAIIIWRRRT
ncbi:MAG: multiheme c-type cytochrome [Archaeoglobaceae archaeon]